LAIQAWEILCGEASFEVIVDLREPDMFARGHMCGARNLPYGRFQDEALACLPEGPAVLVVDPGGARAAEMATWLRRRGRPAAYLEGGMAAWTGPLERGAGA